MDDRESARFKQIWGNVQGSVLSAGGHQNNKKCRRLGGDMAPKGIVLQMLCVALAFILANISIWIVL